MLVEADTINRMLYCNDRFLSLISSTGAIDPVLFKIWVDTLNWYRKNATETHRIFNITESIVDFMMVLQVQLDLYYMQCMPTWSIPTEELHQVPRIWKCN